MPILSYSLPTVGNPNSTEDPIIRTALSSIQSEYNTNIANMLGHYKPLFFWSAILSPGVMTSNATFILLGAAPSGTCQVATDTASAGIQAPYLDPTSLAITGYATKLRIRASITTNGTAPAANFTPGLYPLTASGGTGANNNYTLGTVHVATAVFTAPAANSLLQAVSSDISVPSAGYLSAAVVSSAALAANSRTSLTIYAEYRHV